jgi:excisionase family DNA binding protein
MTFKEFALKNQTLWLSPKQVAKLMQCSIEHVYDLAKSGKIGYIKDGKNVRFRPKDLDDYELQSFVRRK